MLQGYLRTLLAEISLWGERLPGRRAESLFFGGGTPSLLPVRAIAAILEAIDKRFPLVSGAEITAEANPESALADGWLFGVKGAGINRLSLGVQSFSDADLLRLGRAHDAHAAEAAFLTAKAAGFGNISLDLMWGLPRAPLRPQSQVRWLEQLHRLAELRPEHVSAYGLTLEEGSALEAACARGEYSLPEESAAASMYVTGGEFLESRGYMQYEISNYARIGFECRHNLGYWQGEDYLGFGPSATSTLAGRRWSNPADPALWRESVRSRSAGNDAEILSAGDQVKELLMLRLRMSKGLCLGEYQALSGRAFHADFGALAGLLQQKGLAASREGHFRLTRSGMLLSDAVLAHFFTALP